MSVQRGVEVGKVAFESHLLLTLCASESQGAKVSDKALQWGNGRNVQESSESERVHHYTEDQVGVA